MEREAWEFDRIQEVGGKFLKTHSTDFWVVAVDNMQHNWAIIEKVNDVEFKIIFFSDTGEVFDTLSFESFDKAKKGLERNFFERWAGCDGLKRSLKKPELPLYELPNLPKENKGGYSSGGRWVVNL